MSNFLCEKCGASILEGANGKYVTECAHYPLTHDEKDPKNHWLKPLSVHKGVHPFFTLSNGKEKV